MDDTNNDKANSKAVDRRRGDFIHRCYLSTHMSTHTHTHVQNVKWL